MPPNLSGGRGDAVATRITLFDPVSGLVFEAADYLGYGMNMVDVTTFYPTKDWKPEFAPPCLANLRNLTLKHLPFMTFEHIVASLSQTDLQAEAKRINAVIADRTKKLKGETNKTAAAHLEKVIALRSAKLAAVEKALTALLPTPAPTQSSRAAALTRRN